MTPLTRKHTFDEVFDSQKVYRLLLTAFSNPPRTVSVREYADKLPGEEPALLALAFTLLDNEVSFAVCGCDALAGDIALFTLSQKTAAEDADFLFVTDPALLETAIGAAKCGTLRDPQKSATLIVKNSGELSFPLALSGPGIRGTARLTATDTVRTALALRDAQEYESPQGIDLIFVSEDGGLVALPRLVRKEAL
jgi:alpha-D-ribose 1-methylphosphonate 5-triphosphate synthase subunit PhnH